MPETISDQSDQCI